MEIKKLEFTTVDNFVKIYSQNQELALDFKKFVRNRKRGLVVTGYS